MAVSMVTVAGPNGWQEISWPSYVLFRDRFADLLDPNLYTLEWLDNMVLTGQFHLFTQGNSAILVSLKLYPTGVRECHVEAAVGELSLLTGPLISTVEQWASKIGCALVVIQSREGWLKVMKSQGYSPYQIAIRKEL